MGLAVAWQIKFPLVTKPLGMYNYKMQNSKAIQDRKAALEENVRLIVSTLLECYAPEKIILFGSLAAGNITETSDLDILLIMKTSKNFFDRLHDIATICEYNVGADIIVYTPDEFEVESKENPFIIEEVLNKGVVLYDRAA